MSINPNRTLFVYRRKTEPHTVDVVWIEDTTAHPKAEWDHVATLDPRMWVQAVLNHNIKEISEQINATITPT
jgi:hypothetical protein